MQTRRLQIQLEAQKETLEEMVQERTKALEEALGKLRETQSQHWEEEPVTL